MNDDKIAKLRLVIDKLWESSDILIDIMRNVDFAIKEIRDEGFGGLDHLAIKNLRDTDEPRRRLTHLIEMAIRLEEEHLQYLQEKGNQS